MGKGGRGAYKNWGKGAQNRCCSCLQQQRYPLHCWLGSAPMDSGAERQSAQPEVVQRWLLIQRVRVGAGAPAAHSSTQCACPCRRQQPEQRRARCAQGVPDYSMSAPRSCKPPRSRMLSGAAPEQRCCSPLGMYALAAAAAPHLVCVPLLPLLSTPSACAPLPLGWIQYRDAQTVGLCSNSGPK